MNCDIIIPVWNQLEFTRDCINSVIQNTRYPYRLIVVDNGSNAETKSYLEGLKENKGPELILIRNEENLGFPRAANQGMRSTSAPYLCLLNNDTLVGPGWLTEMVKVAEQSPGIGLVNPSSNTLGRKLNKGETLQAIAAARLGKFSGRYAELAWACGFCMLIKRIVIEKTGEFDEIYGMGNFEDADLSKKAQQAGFSCVCALGAYVYHRERRSFIKMRKFDRHFEHNRRIFQARWGRSQRLLYILSRDGGVNKQQINQELLESARQGNVVWLFIKEKDRPDFTKHSNIYIFSLAPGRFKLISAWRILKRKKKFDKIYLDDENYVRQLNSLRIFHQAEIVLLSQAVR